MARGPYQGTFLPNVRPTIVTAPDAIVYINGEREVLSCPKCSRAFDFNKYITTIQTDLSIESAPGSASIQLAIPRHTIDDFYFDGNPVITPMMEIEIFAKGYYLVEGIPQYYPIFWGLITEVSDNYSGGEHTISISCADILKWWELCQININPAYTAAAGQRGRNLGNSVFARMNPYDMIFSLAFQSFGDIVVGTGSLNQLVSEARQKPTFDAALSDMMAYWEKRFSRMRNSLVLYGTQGVAVRGDTLYQAYYSENKGRVPRQPYASTAVCYANGGTDAGQMVFDPTSNRVAAFRYDFQQSGIGDLWQSEFQSKLELANAAKEAIGFEFYMDVTGDIVFKPPFYNLDVLGNKPLSWIQDIDVIDWDFGDSESEVVTQIVLQGQLGGIEDYGAPADLTPFTSVVDYHLLRKYGWRSRPLNSEFLSNVYSMYYHGLDMLDRINSRRHRGSISIPMRPELRLGFPVYVAPKDQIWYLEGISHSIAFGSRATTSLTLTAKRSKFIAPRGVGDLKLVSFNGIAEADKEGTPSSFHYSSRQLSQSGTFSLDVRNAATTPPTKEALTNVQPGADNPYEPLILRHPKTGRIVGYPNVVMVYTRPFAPADIRAQAGQDTDGSEYVSKENQEKNIAVARIYEERVHTQFKANEEDALVDKYLTNRYQYGLNSAGVYIYAHDSSARGGAISEILTIKKDKIAVTPKEDAALSALAGQTGLIRPVSDERGFEVIGHYRYGRRISLRDGRLITNVEAGVQTRATVDIQLALSGDMQEMLTAQSQGLTTISTGYADPASTLTKLTPEDRQTGAILNPDSRQPEFIDVGDNFIDNAPLGSQERQGSPEVEASQLSRALTIMEMSVKDSSTKTKEDCVCLTGRQDLTFMNSGYQVRTLSGNAEADTSILKDIGIGGSITSGALEEAEEAIQTLQIQLATAENRLQQLLNDASAGPPEGVTEEQAKAVNAAKSQAVTDQQKVVDSLTKQLAVAERGEGDLRKQYNTATGLLKRDGTDLISKVDQFLVNLYKDLDTYHQQFEKAIRGDLLPMTPRVVATKTEQINRLSEFAPPFSAPNRFALGDPKATSGAIQTNADNIAESWSQFGKNLRDNSSKAFLSKQISQDQLNIQRLTKRREQLIQQQQSSAVVIGVDVPKAIEQINQKIAELQKNVADNQTKLKTGT
jgi:hypothetical protein